MIHNDAILYIVVATALVFDFTNGFHDTANAVASSISTKAMSPRVAVTLSAALNFAGAFLSLAVAATIAQDVVSSNLITTTVVFAGLIGAIAWNIATWYFGLPSSSTHALVGGVVGAALVANGAKAVFFGGLLDKIVIPAVISPVLALLVAAVAIIFSYRIVGGRGPGIVKRSFRRGQIVSGCFFSLAHGINDAQKTMGVILLALIANGNLAANTKVPPTWVVISAASAIALGTYVGGWRVIRTVGTRIIKMDPVQGFASQAAGAAVVIAGSLVGYPLSTTHIASGAVMGAGAGKRISAVRWGVAGNIALAWVITLPIAAAFGAGTYAIVTLFGKGSAGPITLSTIALLIVMAVFIRRFFSSRAAPAQP